MLREEAVHVAARVRIIDSQRETLIRLTEKRVRCRSLRLTTSI